MAPTEGFFVAGFAADAFLGVTFFVAGFAADAFLGVTFFATDFVADFIEAGCTEGFLRATDFELSMPTLPLTKLGFLSVAIACLFLMRIFLRS